MSLQDHFRQAVNVSQEIKNQATDLYTLFNKQYAESRGFKYRGITCHTSSFAVLRNVEDTGKMKPMALLKMVYNLLGSWTIPLQHLAKEVGSLQGAPAALLSKAQEIEKPHKGLLEGVRKLIRRSGDTENVKYLTWSGLTCLQSTYEETLLFGFYKLFYCLHEDSVKVSTNLKLLEDKMVTYNC
ncbi:prolactin-like [Nannospalax galili]|uniref:prolactin-like n=1 Tax=Nannospalax galili TaxID=1026970 RepID=UPI000819EB4A|nr:prolactin-like [Nannospalax galili]